MTGEAAGHRGKFYLGFLVVALLLAGVVSYMAYPHPDGLDTVTRQGCEATEVNGAERLTGTCIARHVTEPATAGSPFADYAVHGNSALTGAAGIVGVLVTLAVAGALFWLLRRRGAPSDLSERSGRPKSD